MQFELAARRETTILIDTRHARHFSFSLQLQIFQSAVFKWRKVDLQTNLRPFRRGRRTNYKDTQNTDIARVANTPSFFPDRSIQREIT